MGSQSLTSFINMNRLGDTVSNIKKEEQDEGEWNIEAGVEELEEAEENDHWGEWEGL